MLLVNFVNKVACYNNLYNLASTMQWQGYSIMHTWIYL